MSKLTIAAMLLIALMCCVEPAAADEPVNGFRLPGDSSSYALDLTLDEAEGTLSGTERVVYRNTTGERQNAIPFRLYPNAGYYGEGSLQVDRVRVRGELVTPTFAAEATVMTVPLPEPLAPGDEVSIAIRFTTTVPADSTGTFGIFSRDLERGSWILADWYPILAGWEAGSGWRLDPPTDYGDPTYSETATYDLRLTMPAGWEVAATGTEMPGTTSNGMTRWRIETGPVRELALVIDDDFRTTSRTVDGTVITVHTEGDGAADAGAAIALEEAAKSLPHYSEVYGGYPFTELDLVETEMAGALGVSWSGVVFLNGAQLLANPFYVEQEPGRLAFTV
ncbi:MAG: hypothetical protein IT336_02740, partial [Thermomicrobiales bacterium]|nr:hypothetical protein [Thermomicrobiales bacterium]